MRRILSIIICITLSLPLGCEVHQWPDSPKYVKCNLRLNYETDMTVWEHHYSDASIVEYGIGETYDNHRDNGKIRYIIRTYPIVKSQNTIDDYSQEFVFTKDIALGYDHNVTLDLLPGEYKIMVWSDILEGEKDSYYHDVTKFSEIRLQGEYSGNNDYRDAFRGCDSINLVSDIMERMPDTLDIKMQRPLAKFEIITNDIQEFIEKENSRIYNKIKNSSSASVNNSYARGINIDDYKVIIYYVGFMPDAYNINTDKPVDASTGIMFESSLKKITETEFSVGFDYVFVNGKSSEITIQIGIYDKEGTQLLLTVPINIPLRRSYHTTLMGKLITSNASGGVVINPDYDGDHNLMFP